MSEEIPELGEIAYVGYFKASDGKSLISGAPLPAWDEQAPEIRQAWNLAAMAVVDRWSEAGEEPEPVEVVIVTEHGGRERHYAANGWDAEDAVDVTRDGEVIATYPPGAWTRIHREGATLPDVTARKLSLAMQALRDIASTVLEADDKRRVPVGAARDALEQISDVDL